MSELKKCPFCGWEFAEHAWNEFGEEYRVCDQCGASSGTVDSKWDWQSRPIEDAINARIAELEEENDRLQSAWFEDETICPDGSLRPKVSTLLDRIAELEAAQRWIPVPQSPEVQESEATSCKFCGSNKSDRRMNSIVCSGCGRKIGNVAPPEVQE